MRGSMNAEQIADAVLRLPKVELHVHFEGAVDAETVWTMALLSEMESPCRRIRLRVGRSISSFETSSISSTSTRRRRA